MIVRNARTECQIIIPNAD